MYSEKTIQILSLLIALCWSAISYINFENSTSPIFILLGLGLFTKFVWIPNMDIEKNSKELRDNLLSLQTEKND
jgi:hypothetical protein